MVTLGNLRSFVDKGHGVTVIGPSEYHYYSGMGPGMLGMTYTPDDIRFATRKVVERQGGVFILDAAERIDPVARKVILKSGGTVPYDVLSVNAGSYVPNSLITENRGDIFPVKPIEKLLMARERVLELCRERHITVGIVGGGPSSAEIAGNIRQLIELDGGYQPQIIIFAGSSFMKRFPAAVRRRVRNILRRNGVEIREGEYVREVETFFVTLESGAREEVDVIFMAVGVKPSPIFADSKLAVGPDGGLLVNGFLQARDYPEIFGGGDCIHFAEKPLDKVGVYAVRENPVLFHNLTAAMEGGALQAFDPGGAYLLIFNVGNGEGVLHKYFITFGGKLAFTIKDYIDRKFMRLFQAMEK